MPDAEISRLAKNEFRGWCKLRPCPLPRMTRALKSRLTIIDLGGFRYRLMDKWTRISVGKDEIAIHLPRRKFPLSNNETSVIRQLSLLKDVVGDLSNLNHAINNRPLDFYLYVRRRQIIRVLGMGIDWPGPGGLVGALDAREAYIQRKWSKRRQKQRVKILKCDQKSLAAIQLAIAGKR